MSMSSFAGKTIIITGGSSGIGFGTAVHFAQLAAKLVLSGRNEKGLNDAKAACIKAGAAEKDVVYVIGEITDTNVRKQLIQKAIDAFGAIDVLVNNAGIAPTNNICDGSGPLALFDQIMDVNIRAVIELCQLAAPHLIKSKGNIVNISAVASLKPIPKLYYYSMSKCALDMFTQCLAQELAPKGVRVNGINPAGVSTPMLNAVITKGSGRKMTDQERAYADVMHPIGRVGEVEDIANAIAFLASNKGSWITGTNLKVDGGMMIRGEKVLDN